MVDHAPVWLIPVVWTACGMALAVMRRREQIRAARTRHRKHT